jgi:hypothetical protein
MNDFGRVFFVLGLSREGESILGLAIGDLVDPEFRASDHIHVALMKYTPEPFIGRSNQTRQIPLYVLDIIKFGRQ